MAIPMSQVLTQILVILLYVIVGFVAGKVKVINPEQRKYLTGLCSNLILPFTILSASSQQMDGETMTNFGLATAVMFGLLGGTLVLMLLYHRVRHTPAPLRAATTGLITFPNCTFLGLPLCQALFGDIAVLYNASAILAFNVYFFTVQYTLFTGKGFRLKNLATPPVISTAMLIVMLLLGLHFPTPVQTICSNIGAMISPLSLIIIGVMMSESDLMAMLKEKRAYVVTLLRNLVIPFAAILLLTLIPMDLTNRLCVLVFIATPCGTLTSIYAIRENMEPELCARTVLLSTVCFAGTLPVIILLGQLLLK